MARPHLPLVPAKTTSRCVANGGDAPLRVHRVRHCPQECHVELVCSWGQVADRCWRTFPECVVVIVIVPPPSSRCRIKSNSRFSTCTQNARRLLSPRAPRPQSSWPCVAANFAILLIGFAALRHVRTLVASARNRLACSVIPRKPSPWCTAEIPEKPCTRRSASNHSSTESSTCAAKNTSSASQRSFAEVEEGQHGR